MAEEIDDTTCCPVCFEHYEETGNHIPRLLPCTHTLCHQCVGSLIRDATLTCPQDRQKHIAGNGPLTFPQNKYILKHLKKPKISEEEDSLTAFTFQQCHVHGRELSLFCKDSKCQEEICQLCHINTHQGHCVVDILQELERQRNDIARNIQCVKTVAKSRRDTLCAAKRQLVDICERTTSELKKRRETIVKAITATINEVEEQTKEEQKSIDEKMVELDKLLKEVGEEGERVKRCNNPIAMQEHTEMIKCIKLCVLDISGIVKYYEYNSNLAEDFLKRKETMMPLFVDINTFGKEFILLNKMGSVK